MGYAQGLGTLICVNLMAVMGLSLLSGFTGLFSFGHAGYMALGAYTSAIVVTRMKVPFLVGMLAGVIVAGLASLVIGYPSLRLSRDYFALAALGFGEAVRLLGDVLSITGGSRGFYAVPKFTTLPVALLILIVGLVLMRNILNSRYGLWFVAIREDELAASSMGINATRLKMLSLSISAMYAAVAGSMFAHYLMFLQPAMFDMNKSTELASCVVFGGLGSLTGSMIAGVILTVIPELFRPFYLWRMVFYGIALVGTIVLRPQGLMGGHELSGMRLKSVWARWSTSRRSGSRKGARE